MLKKILLVFIFLIFLCFTVTINLNINVKAEEVNLSSIDNTLATIFSGKTVKYSDYLYDFDEIAHYIYVEFNEGGYCIISKKSGNISEYSLDGAGPYEGNESTKYYLGPTSYLIKLSENNYLNILNDEVISYTNEEIETFNVTIEKITNLIDDGDVTNLERELNDLSNINSLFTESSDFGTLSQQQTSSTQQFQNFYIDNDNYFTSNPSQGENLSLSCGAVAAQLLLSYHNYYSDRRIIDVSNLNGGWNNATGDNNIYNPNNYSSPEENPNVCSDPALMNWYTLGSTGVDENDSEDDTYFGYLNSKIPLNCSINNLYQKIELILEERNNELIDDIEYEVDYVYNIFEGFGFPVSSSGIVDEISNGRPVILLMQYNLGASSDHYVVGYGYQNTVLSNGSTKCAGYFVHYGYGKEWYHNYLNEFVNSAWFCGYVTLNINHTHNYNVVTENIVNNTQVEVRCGECGHRKMDDIYTVSDNSISSVNYPIFGDIEIPSSIDGNTITSISEEAFKDLTGITSIIIPYTIENIGQRAFENCTSLVSVNIQREGNDITYVQENVFDGCSNSLQIIVPRNKLVEYANSDYLKVYSSKIVPNNNNFEEINLNCLVDNDKSIYLNTGYNMLYKLDVDCSKSYKFTSDDDVLISIYNSNMQQLYLGEKNISGFLSCGTYYLDVRFNSNTESGFIDINYTLTWQSNETLILTNSMTNIFSDLHLINDNFYHGRLYLLNEQGAGFFNFSLNIYTNIIYPENAIQVYSDSERTNLLNRYPIENIDYGASSIRKENQMCVYLPESGYYYINILLPAGSYSFVEFNVSNIDSQEIDYSISILNNSLKVLFENKNTISYFKEVTMSHTSKIQFDIFTSGNFTENIPVYVFKKNIINEENIGSTFDEIELQYVDYITTIDTSPVFTINLPAGTYYFGFSDNIKNINISFSLVRIVDNTIDKDNTLVADPYHEGYTLGSEVTLNNGLCDEYTITEGFTRNIYLMVEDRVLQPMSRLDYDWYSSCESVAVVTNYGTVLAKNVETDTQVTIYAILKEDPSIIYRKTFTILNDLSTEEIEITCDMSYSYSNLNGIYKLELNSSNSPFPMIQYYDWSVENQDEDLMVEINNWGYVSSNGGGNVVVIGTYTLNPRVIIYINLTITN